MGDRSVYVGTGVAGTMELGGGAAGGAYHDLESESGIPAGPVRVSIVFLCCVSCSSLRVNLLLHAPVYVVVFCVSSSGLLFLFSVMLRVFFDCVSCSQLFVLGMFCELCSV